MAFGHCDCCFNSSLNFEYAWAIIVYTMQAVFGNKAEIRGLLDEQAGAYHDMVYPSISVFK